MKGANGAQTAAAVPVPSSDGARPPAGNLTPRKKTDPKLGSAREHHPPSGRRQRSQVAWPAQGQPRDRTALALWPRAPMAYLECDPFSTRSEERRVGKE